MGKAAAASTIPTCRGWLAASFARSHESGLGSPLTLRYSSSCALCYLGFEGLTTSDISLSLGCC